ncbi:MAG: transporter substrate-binding domain-containing protein [Ruminococcaceae bacterium]|nr:transporter substrate-binding domain-containing protein [Oscillospiraceae bacterium]
MKKLASLIMAGIMCLSMASCGKKTASDKSYITDNGKMVIGMTIYEPMNYEDENGELTGFDTEFAKAVCEKLGVEAEFVEIDWDNKFPELSSRSIDCIWNGMTITDEVRLNADVSKAYVKNAQVVVMNKEKVADYQSLESLADLKFAAEAGSAGETAIIDAGLEANLVSTAAQTDALLEVKSGSADACVIDITMANAMTGEGTSYAELGIAMELTTEEYGIAFRKGSDLTEEVNALMDELKADGTLDALAEKYSLTLAL